MPRKQIGLLVCPSLRKAKGNCSRLAVMKMRTRSSCSGVCWWWLRVCMAQFATRKRAKQETSACHIFLNSSRCCLKLLFTLTKRGWKVFLKNQHLEKVVAALQSPGMGSWGAESAAEVCTLRWSANKLGEGCLLPQG